MFRSLYLLFVRLHPAAFRRRFGDQMVSIFDASEGRSAALVGDAAFSLTRQWLFRPQFHEPANPSRPCVAGIPMFLVLDDDPRLTPGEWMGGALLSLIAFMAASILINLGGHPSTASIGSSGLRSSAFGVTSRAPGANLDTQVVVTPAPQALDNAAIRRMATAYFRSIEVLAALDANRDLVISADEIANAPGVLKGLDTNDDGALDASECRPNSARLFKTRLGDGGFMTLNPVLAALDTNHDGIISAAEIRTAPASLQSLDSNRDGKLTAEELLPPGMLKTSHE